MVALSEEAGRFFRQHSGRHLAGNIGRLMLSRPVTIR